MANKAGHGRRETLAVTAVVEIPLREVSGLAVAVLRGGLVLAAVGDHGPNVALAPVHPDGELGAWEVIDLSALDSPPGAPAVEQAEAVATDGAQHAMVLIEDPALLLVLDTAKRRLTHAYQLDAGQHEGLGQAWREDPSSRGEGMLLLREGHVLVVKEKKPAGLLEFGPKGDAPVGLSSGSLHPRGQEWVPPAGDRLHGLAWWPIAHTLKDISDADIGPDGGLYLLSDQSNAIAEVRLPLAPGAAVEFVEVWALPDSIEKAEGLTFLADGAALVAVDHKHVSRNLAILPPIATWPRR
jgi:hypothetical protein